MRQFRILLSALAAMSLASANFLKPAAAGIVEVPLITPVPVFGVPLVELGKRQVTKAVTGDAETVSDFLGWYQTGSANDPLFCNPGYTWTSEGEFATCCTRGTSCAQLTTCTESSVIIDQNGVMMACITGGCGTATIYEEWPTSNPLSMILCTEGFSQYTLYRRISTTEAVTSEGSKSTDGSSQNQTTRKKMGKEGIIGGVVGGIVAVILVIVGVVVFLWRRRKARKAAEAGSPSNEQATPSENDLYAADPKYQPVRTQEFSSEADSRPFYAYEMQAQNKPVYHEMPAQYPQYEMPNSAPLR